MKLKCIDNKHRESELTIGKKYDVWDDGDRYSTISDDGEKCIFFKYRFATLNLERKLKLEKLNENRR